MTIFLDSANIDYIKDIMDQNLASGITTNPKILAKDGVTAEALDLTYTEIMYAAKGPVSLELLNFNDSYEQLLEEALKYYNSYNFHNCHEVVIKVPFVYPKGTELISHLTEKHIPVNVTCLMSAHQAILAVQQNPWYISFFFNRMLDFYRTIEDMPDEEYSKPELSSENLAEANDYVLDYVLEQIRVTREYIDSMKLDVEIICGSIRNIHDAEMCLAAGAHIVTLPYNILLQMLEHPKTDEAVEEFNNAWNV